MKLSHKSDYLNNVIGQIYYFSGKPMQAEKFYLKSIQDNENQVSIYQCLSKEWLAYIKYFDTI